MAERAMSGKVGMAAPPSPSNGRGVDRPAELCLLPSGSLGVPFGMQSG